jgi:hypothetical protein
MIWDDLMIKGGKSTCVPRIADECDSGHLVPKAQRSCEWLHKKMKDRWSHQSPVEGTIETQDLQLLALVNESARIHDGWGVPLFEAWISWEASCLRWQQKEKTWELAGYRWPCPVQKKPEAEKSLEQARSAAANEMSGGAGSKAWGSPMQSLGGAHPQKTEDMGVMKEFIYTRFWFWEWKELRNLLATDFWGLLMSF